MRGGRDPAVMPGVPGGVAGAELLREVRPLEEELAPGLGDPDLESRSLDDAGEVEGIASGLGLGVDEAEIRRHGCDGIRMGPKTGELGMPGVAASPPAKGGLGQERLPPERDEACRVEVARMEGPDAQLQ